MGEKMTVQRVRQELIGKPAVRDHAARFYADDEDLARAVADHLREGLRQGEALLVAATPEHWEAIVEVLEHSDIDPAALESTGRLVVLDAVETLERIMGDKAPDPIHFQRIIGGSVQQALRNSDAGRVRAYGELVDLLWQADDRMSALRVEQYWDGLLLSYPVSLLCGYRTGLLDPEADPADVEHLCTRHSEVQPCEGRAPLDEAVEVAFRDLIGTDRAHALRPLIDAMIFPTRSFGQAERTIFWTRRNLPDRLEPLLQRSRVQLDQMTRGP